MDNDPDDDEIKTILIFDLGGGTLDVSILNVFGPSVEVAGTSGDTYLGGRDFDEKVVNFCVEQFMA